MDNIYQNIEECYLIQKIILIRNILIAFYDMIADMHSIKSLNLIYNKIIH